MPPLERTRAVVLRTVDYGDSDRIVHLLTRRHGRGAAFARGARKSRRRFAGTLQPGTEVDCELSHRGGGGMWSLRSTELRVSSAGLGADLEAMARAHYALEICYVALPEHHPEPSVYDLLAAFVARCCDGFASSAEASRTLVTFELPLLQVLGWSPTWTRCAQCGRPWGGKSEVRFYPGRGGLLCPNHAPADLREGVPLDWDAARTLASGDAVAMQELSVAALDCARRCLADTWHAELGRPLSSAAFLQQMEQVS